MKRWLYLAHRWLGIPLCVVMALWSISGMVMLYVGYPKLTPDERHQGLAPLRADGCCVGLATALQAAGLGDATQGQGRARASMPSWRLANVAGQPYYLFGNGGGKDSGPAVAVDARSGQRVLMVDANRALASALHFAHSPGAQHLGVVQEDAWTHSRALDAHRPLHVVALQGDPAGRWLYVSGRTAEVVRDASATERHWGWLGAWLHWLYMFRGNAFNPWWSGIVNGLSIAGSLAAVTGMVIGLQRWRWRGHYRNGRKTPYPGPAARWHHGLGLAGGLLACTWVLSGLFSMNPWKVFNTTGAQPDLVAYAGGPLQATAAPTAAAVLQQLAQQGHSALELEWQRVGGVHQVLAQGPGGPWVVDAGDLLLGVDGVSTGVSAGVSVGALPEARWRSAAAQLLPGAALLKATRLDAYDAYYAARAPHTMAGHVERPLPVWRLQFGDAHASWVTIDPRTGAIVQTSDRLRRAQRWLFAFPHSFDLPQLLALRPAWDAWMLGFSLAGLGLSVTAAVTGWRRLVRLRRLRWRGLAPAPHQRPFFPSPSPPAGGGWADNARARRLSSLPQDLP